MNSVFLDFETISHSSLDLSPLEAILPNCKYYPFTAEGDLLPRCENVDIIITNKACFTKQILQTLPKLKLICVTATGLDNIALEFAEQQGIKICNVSNYSTDAVVQHTFGMLINIYTNMHRYFERVKNGEWQRAQHFCLNDMQSIELAGKTLGIIGYGTIGRKLALVAKQFGMHVLIAKSYDPNANNYGRIELEEMLPKIDILTLHCPLNDRTRNMIDAQQLSMMKSTAVILNMARGGVVNEQDLLEALKSKKIAAAGLDVLTKEPPDNNVPFFKEEYLPGNLFITPHNAWASIEARQRLVNSTAENIKNFLNVESF